MDGRYHFWPLRQYPSGSGWAQTLEGYGQPYKCIGIVSYVESSKIAARGSGIIAKKQGSVSFVNRDRYPS
jgi:hypothetical protein